MSDQQLFVNSCNTAATFPKNIVRSNSSRHHLNGFFRRLSEEEERIFCVDGQASVDLWEYRDNMKEFRNQYVSSTSQLKSHLQGQILLVQDDPRSRYIFIHAPNARECLRVSRTMFTCALTHHQVMPNFTDFVFPFGYQLYAEDFHFSGFREDTRLLISDGGLQIPELGRSGREVRMCYSLKSVEPHSSKKKWPWSVRQTALYHSFDIVTGKAFWIVIKGSNLIRDRLREATSPNSESNALKAFESTASSFASTLAMHLVLCDWCDEDWRWYLTFLESRLQDLTRHSLAVDIPKAASFVEPEYSPQVKQPTMSFRRTVTDLTKRTLSASRRLTMSSSTSNHTKYQASFPLPTLPPIDQSALQLPPSLPPGIVGHSAPNMPPSLPPGIKLPPSLPPGMGGSTTDHSSDEIFSVRTLQQVQFIEDKTNEVLLILEANIKIVTSIKEHYKTVLASEDCPNELKTDCTTEVAHFRKRIDNIIGDLEIQHSSAMTLLRLLENRKSLLSGLLNIRNIEANKELAIKSQISAGKMEAMTKAMHLIAVKTKKETVSMRIITLVTLFFLPGTFISTIMSTDIIKFPSTQESGRAFQLGALQLYLAITIPMTVVVFAAWWLVYLCVNRRQDTKAFGGTFSGWAV